MCLDASSWVWSTFNSFRELSWSAWFCFWKNLIHFIFHWTVKLILKSCHVSPLEIVLSGQVRVLEQPNSPSNFVGPNFLCYKTEVPSEEDLAGYILISSICHVPGLILTFLLCVWCSFWQSIQACNIWNKCCWTRIYVIHCVGKYGERSKNIKADRNR